METILVLLFLIFYMTLTISIEVGVAYLMGYKTRNFLLVVALASAITNPVLNFLISVNSTLYIFHNEMFLIFILEMIVVAVEFYILCYVFDRKYSRIKLFRVAVVINASSYLLGYLLQSMFRFF